MKTKIPKPLETYLEASNANDLEAFVSCFASDATVLDEGEILRGRDAIGKWFSKTKKKYNHQTELLDVKRDGNEVLLRNKVSGTFKGSPVEIQYRITLHSDLIGHMEIG